MPTYAVVNGQNPGPVQHPAITLVGANGAPYNPTVYLAAPINILAIAAGATLNGQAGVYQDVSAAAAVASGATSVLLHIYTRDITNTTAAYINLRKKGVTTGGLNTDGSVCEAHASNVYTSRHYQVGVNTSGVFQYKPTGYSVANGELYIDVISYIV